MMKTIVLTGASGFLGQHVLRALLLLQQQQQQQEQPFRVLALAHRNAVELETAVQEFLLHNNNKNHSCVVVSSVDLTCPESIESWLKQQPNDSINKIDVCLHTAAWSSPAHCEADPATATVHNVPTHFFNALAEHNPHMRVVALSTDQVYDGSVADQQQKNHDNDTTNNAADLFHYTEESLAVPVNHYGRTKLAMEDFVLTAFPNTAILLRSSIILGPNAPFSKAHDTFLHFCASRKDTATTFYTDEMRSVIAVSDVVRILLTCCGCCGCTTNTTTNNNTVDVPSVPVPAGIYCMGGPAAVSRHDMAVATLSYLQMDATSIDAVAIKATKKSSLSSQTQQPQNNNNNTAVAISPLHIAMDSSKLYAAVGMKATQLQTLEEMVVATFAKKNNEP